MINTDKPTDESIRSDSKVPDYSAISTPPSPNFPTPPDAIGAADTIAPWAAGLVELGWNAELTALFEPFAGQGCVPGRVARQDRDRFRVLTATGEKIAQVAGAFRHKAASPADFPVVGDWVALTAAPSSTPPPSSTPTPTPTPTPPPTGAVAVVRGVLPRKTRISRVIVGGRTDEQVIAANVSLIFLLAGLDRDFNIRRLERYLALGAQSGAEVAIVLNKADLCPDPDRYVAMVETIAGGAPIVAVSAITGLGLEAVRDRLGPATTVVMLGSSGVGKSTLMNALLGAEWGVTQAVRDNDGRGQHTTTWREMVRLPTGGLLIDTPGLRELQIWSEGEGDDDADGTFADIAELAAHCRFRDCEHIDEPGCAVQAAISAGDLDAGRLENWSKMQREAAYLARRMDDRAKRDEKARWKSIHRSVRPKTQQRKRTRGS